MRFQSWRKLKFGKPTLLQTLIVAFVLPLSLTGALVEYLAWKQEQKAMESLVWQLQTAVSDRIKEKVSYLTKAPVRATFQIARALRRGDLSPDELTSWKAYMADQGQVFEDVTFIYFGNSSGDFVTLYQRTGLPDQVSFRAGEDLTNVVRYQLTPGEDQILEQTTQRFDARTRPWYRAAVAAERPVWTEPYEFFITTSNKSGEDLLTEATGITFVVPYYLEFNQETDAETGFVLSETDDKTLLGVIGVDFTLEDMDRFLSRIEMSASAEAFIINRQGDLIASSHPLEMSQKKNLPLSLAEADNDLIEAAGAFLKSQFGNFENVHAADSLGFELEGERQLLRVQPYGDSFGLDWLMVVVVPESDFLGPIREETKIRLLISLAVLSGVVLLLLAIARRINRSMQGLSQASQSIAAGNLHQVVSGSFIQEIDVTANAFNQMGKKLEASYAQLKEYSKSLEDKVKERTQSLEQEVCDRTRSEATFRNLVSNIPGTVYRCSCSTDWVMEFMSDSIEELSGYPASDFVQNKERAYLDIIFPEDIEKIMPITEAAINQAEPYVLEYRIRHADGSFRWIYDKGRGVFDEGGKMLYLDGAFFDITALKQAEESLQYQGEIDSLLSRVSRSLLEQKLDNAINFALEQIGRFTGSDRTRIFQFDSHGQFQLTHHWTHEASPVYVETRKYISSTSHAWFYRQLVAGQVLQFTTLDSLPPDAETSKVALQRQGVLSLLDVPMRYANRAAGLVTLDTVHQPKKWTEPEIRLVRLVGEMIAMAQQKHVAELKLLRAKERAELASRAKSDFLASMSHELRSPLNAILGFAQIMQRSPHLSDYHQDDVQIINRSGEHLLTLINNVLDMSKIEAGRTTLNPIDFDLHSMLQDLYGMFTPSAEEKHIQIKQDYSDNLPRYINADKGKLQQVLINLLNNSLKFTHRGVITLSAQPQQQDLKERESLASAILIQFSVSDTGTGIDAADVQKVFEPFVQSQSGRNSQEGTGLGLSICRKFVQLMGGEISLASRSDGIVGTVVTFNIRAQKSTAQAADPEVPKQEILGLASGQPKYKILVVDDKAANRQLLVKLLEPLGLEIKTANDGKAAVEIAGDWHPDLVWMDLRMPVMNGIEATKRIREITRTDSHADRPKIVALSATSFVKERADAIAAGCNTFIAKPFRTAEIFDCMAEQLTLRYRYAIDSTETDNSPSSHYLDRQAVAALSPQLLSNLEAAIRRLNWNEILRLIEQISARDPVLAEAISKTVHDFQYRQILEAIAH